MSAISLPLLPRKKEGNIRQVNALRDLPKIADLVELCFHKTMDNEGRRYISQMLHAGKNKNYLQWATTSMPMLGFVWEEENRIVGNISVVPFPKKQFLLANIATHPEYRQRGIARQLTERGIQFARERGAQAIWLHVEKENQIAIHLYRTLGFLPEALRTTWNAEISNAQFHQKNPQITTRLNHFWTEQSAWLNQTYPEELRWYRMPNFQVFAPGIKNWFYRLFVEYDLRQWGFVRNKELQAVLSWLPTHTERTPLWLAAAPNADAAALAALLRHARTRLAAHQTELYIDYPENLHTEAFTQAGFSASRTLLWMKAPGRA